MLGLPVERLYHWANIQLTTHGTLHAPLCHMKEKAPLLVWILKDVTCPECLKRLDETYGNSCPSSS